jgi:hypothetical protein
MLFVSRRHGHNLPADQLDALVFPEDAGRRHLFKLGKGEVSPRQAFGGGGGQRDGETLDAHGITI